MHGPQARDEADREVGPAGLRPNSLQGRLVNRLAASPWWAIALLLVGVAAYAYFFTDPLYRGILGIVSQGVQLTLRVTVVAYSLAMVIGLLAGIGRLSRHSLLYGVATLYVQVVRGIPTLTFILYVAYVLGPIALELLNGLGRSASGALGPDNWLATLSIRRIGRENISTIALAIAYGAFQAETFRAGIQSVSRGQIDAAHSLGMNTLQAMRFIILPQAVRVVLPPLGNDFISLLKDTALLSALGGRDITGIARQHAQTTFLYVPIFNVVIVTYLTLTLLLSLLVKGIEHQMSRSERAV